MLWKSNLLHSRVINIHTMDLIGEDANPALELAYALTVPQNFKGRSLASHLLSFQTRAVLLSRELLYTALTRQRNKVIVFHQGPLHEIKRYSEPVSEAAAD